MVAEDEEYWELKSEDEERWKRTHLLQKTHNETMPDQPPDTMYGWHPRLRPTELFVPGGWFAGFMCMQRAVGSPYRARTVPSVLEHRLPERSVSPPVE